MTVVNSSKMSTFPTPHQLCSYIFIFMEAYKLLLCSLMEATFDMYEVEQWAVGRLFNHCNVALLLAGSEGDDYPDCYEYYLL